MLRKTVLRFLAIALLSYARPAQAQHEEFQKKLKADIEAGKVLINGTMRDWWDASLSVQRYAVLVLRGGVKLGLTTREQIIDLTSANVDLGTCMGEHTFFPHADPEAFRPETTVKIAFEACMKQLHIEPSTDLDHPNGPNWKPSETAQNLEKFRQDVEAAKTLINGTMRDWSDASLGAQNHSVVLLRGDRQFGQTGEQFRVWRSANTDLGQCMREHTFPHADPEAFRPDATVKVAFEACMKQLNVEPSTDPDHPNGPNWKRSEAAEQMRREAANTLINGTMRDWRDASLSVQRRAVHVLRGKPKLGLTGEQLRVWTSANTDLGQCMGAFPHADPQAFRPEATVKVAFDACMKQLNIEPSTDPDHPNGPSWKRSEATEKRRQDIEAGIPLSAGRCGNGGMRLSARKRTQSTC